MDRFLNFINNIKFLIKSKALPGVLVIVCRNRNKRRIFLVIKSMPSNAVTFPSGSLNPFEDFREAAIRELLEETGLEIKKSELISIPLIHKFKYKNLPLKIESWQQVLVVFLKRNCSITTPRDRHVVWRRWYGLNKVFLLLSYGELKTTFRRVLDYLEKHKEYF